MSATLESTIIVGKFKDVNFGGTEVGTGMSMGMDAFDVVHTYYENIDSRLQDFKITSLLVNNNGSFGNHSKNVPMYKFNAIESIGKNLGLPVIYTNSNIHFWRTIHLRASYTYRDASSIIALAKYWKKYYYASSYEISEYNIYIYIYKAGIGPAYFELLFLNCFSYSSFRIYSPNLEKDRLDKAKNIINSPIARKHLDSCNIHANCGECDKCIMNILNIDALSGLDYF